MTTDNINNIWLFPSKGAHPDLTPVIQASNLNDLEDWIATTMQTACEKLEDYEQDTMKDLRNIQKHLAAQGVDFDVDRMMRPTFWDRVMMAWDDLVDWFHEKLSRGDKTDLALQQGTEISTTLAQTHPTYVLSYDYDDIFAETARFRRKVAEDILKDRDTSLLTISLPDHALAFLDEEADWSETQELLYMASEIREIVPPAQTKLGFALTERQEDGGLPIEIDLIAFTQAYYDHLCATISEAGGHIEPLT